MAFNLKADSNEDEIVAEINMTPLIDIMLVLLIIFMVTSSISLESGLDIDIPKTKSKTASQSSDAVIISLDNAGGIFVQGVKVARENLEETIAAALATEKTSLVVFEGDKEATLGRAIEIMDLAKSAGAKKFAIAAESSN